jgi:hypothetical protein
MLEDPGDAAAVDFQDAVDALRRAAGEVGEREEPQARERCGEGPEIDEEARKRHVSILRAVDLRNRKRRFVMCCSSKGCGNGVDEVELIVGLSHGCERRLHNPPSYPHTLSNIHSGKSVDKLDGL